MSKERNAILAARSNELEIVEFTLEYVDSKGVHQKQSFGISVIKIRSIIQIPKLTRLPRMHDSVYGVFQLRESIIPAVDICKSLFGQANAGKTQKMIITNFNNMQMGLIVNEVLSIHRIKWSDIDIPETLSDLGEASASIVGVIKFDGRNLLMLDMEKIIADIDPQSAIGMAGSKGAMFDWSPIAVTADDSSTIRRMIGDRLKKAGFEIQSFNDGAEAWDYLREISDKSAQGEKLGDMVNVVITDIEMPQMNGYELTEKIKGDSNLKDLPVLIFSSIVSEDMLQRGLDAGADAQLTKPQIGELLETLGKLINKDNSQQ
jgi:two-component system chemotaxis response regulator CheV